MEHKLYIFDPAKPIFGNVWGTFSSYLETEQRQTTGLPGMCFPLPQSSKLAPGVEFTVFKYIGKFYFSQLTGQLLFYTMGGSMATRDQIFIMSHPFILPGTEQCFSSISVTQGCSRESRCCLPVSGSPRPPPVLMIC